MPKLKFKLPAIESENLSLLCGPVNTNLNQIEQSLEVKIKRLRGEISFCYSDQVYFIDIITL